MDYRPWQTLGNATTFRSQSTGREFSENSGSRLHLCSSATGKYMWHIACIIAAHLCLWACRIIHIFRWKSYEIVSDKTYGSVLQNLWQWLTEPMAVTYIIGWIFLRGHCLASAHTPSYSCLAFFQKWKSTLWRLGRLALKYTYYM